MMEGQTQSSVQSTRGTKDSVPLAAQLGALGNPRELWQARAAEGHDIEKELSEEKQEEMTDEQEKEQIARMLVRSQEQAEELSVRKRKGLRHYAVKVCRLVQSKGLTTYSTVANDVVWEEKESIAAELRLKRDREREAGRETGQTADGRGSGEYEIGSVDERNIRRRVYDSLNVLMAMGVIERHLKMVTWVGLAEAEYGGGEGELRRLKRIAEERRRAIADKRRLILEMQEQEKRLSALIKRNASQVTSSVVERGFPWDMTQSSNSQELSRRLSLPFIVLIASPQTEVNLAMGFERNNIRICMSDGFSVWDDREILKNMRSIHLPHYELADPFLDTGQASSRFANAVTPAGVWPRKILPSRGPPLVGPQVSLMHAA